MRTNRLRPALAVALATATLGVGGLTAVAATTAPTTTPTGADTRATATSPGFADTPVWVVTGASEYADHFAKASTKIAASRDAAGAPVVLARTTEGSLASFHSGPHADGTRCPGFRTFSSQAQAQEFMAHDLTAQTVDAAFATYSVDNAATVNPWLASVDHTRIKETITRLSTDFPNRYYASSYGRKAAEYVKTTWDAIAAGRSDVTSQLFTGCTTCSTQPSVLLTVQGAELPNEIVVIGGHLDSISSTGSGESMRAPGADDDASGIATVTEVMRVALANGWKPRRTVVFAGYAAEEVGLRGSDAVARSFKAQGRNVVGALQLDMTNYDPQNGVDMAFLTDNVNASLTSFGKKLFDTYLAPAGLVRGDMTCGYACSDHASWTSAGYPSLMAAEPEIFPDLHTTADTLAAMGNTAQPSEKFAKLGLAYLGEMAKTSSGASAPTPTPSPSGSVLTNGVPVTVSGGTGQMKVFTVTVPAGATGLKVTTSGGTGDVDLYLRYGAAPTTSAYDCRPYRSGNAETCTVASPRAGTYHVGTYGYAAYSGVTLTASYTG